MHSEPRVALITGAGKRIGAALACALHAQGFNIALHFWQSQQQTEQLAKQLNTVRANSCVLFQADLNNTEQCTHLIARVIEHFQQLDVLINNASTFIASAIGHSTEQHWDSLFNTNARAPFFLSQAAAPYLKARRGCILNMGDIFGLQAKPGYSIYCMAKAALMMMTQALALELAPDIRVNAIAPGAILWPETAKPESEKSALIQSTPLQRIGHTTDICQAALFLIEHAAFTTGQVIKVDGGRLLGQQSRDSSSA